MLQVNLKNKAVVQTTEPFNSMCKFGEYYLGATENGISKICGYSDNGVEINSSIKSGVTDFGSGNQKRFRFFYVSGESDGDCIFSIYADGVLAGSIDISPSADGFFDIRVPVSRAVVGRYWQWEFKNMQGSFFILGSIKGLPIILSSGRNKG